MNHNEEQTSRNENSNKGSLGFGSILFAAVFVAGLIYMEVRGSSKSLESPPPLTSVEKPVSAVITYQDGRSYFTGNLDELNTSATFRGTPLGEKEKGYSPNGVGVVFSNGWLSVGDSIAAPVSDWSSPKSNCIGGNAQGSTYRVLLCKAVVPHEIFEGTQFSSINASVGEKINIKENEIYLELKIGDQYTNYTIKNFLFSKA